MTETVQVPVDLLNNLKASVINRSGYPGGYGEALVVDTALRDVLNFIPEPIKVGDKIKGAQFATLPPLSVAIDYEGDVWVRTAPGETASIEADGFFGNAFTVAEDSYLAVDFSEGTVVHIGEEVN